MGGPLPEGSEKLGMMGDLLGRLHALSPDDSITRPGGASGEDPTREGSPRQDLMAALSFLDAVDTKVSAAHREQFEQLRNQVRSADDGGGLPEALVHGNLLHHPDHALLTDHGPVAINWKASGIGPRLADFAWLIWGAANVTGGIGAAVGAYRRHVELTSDELDRLESVMYVRPLYLVCFDYRRSLTNGHQPDGGEWWWNFIDPGYISAAATAARAAYR
jgi:Ser/Thr protein kinase RdoA (MazF antagonist)